MGRFQSYIIEPQIYQAQKRCLSAQELLSTHLFATTIRQSVVSGSPKLELDTSSETKVLKMAGNSMNLPSVAAIMLAAILGLELKSA